MNQDKFLKPKIVSQKNFNEHFFALHEDTLLYPSGHEHIYYSLQFAQAAVIILASNSQNEWLVLREYRHPTQEVLWGLPGGLVNEGEDLLECAMRELKEETGCFAQQWAYLGSSYPYPGVSNQKTHFYRAWNTSKEAEPNLDLSELLTSQFFSDKVLSVKLLTEPVDGLLLTALHFNSLLN